VMSIAHGSAERQKPWAFGGSCALCFTAPSRRNRNAGASPFDE